MSLQWPLMFKFKARGAPVIASSMDGLSGLGASAVEAPLRSTVAVHCASGLGAGRMVTSLLTQLSFPLWYFSSHLQIIVLHHSAIIVDLVHQSSRL